MACLTSVGIALNSVVCVISVTKLSKLTSSLYFRTTGNYPPIVSESAFIPLLPFSLRLRSWSAAFSGNPSVRLLIPLHRLYRDHASIRTAGTVRTSRTYPSPDIRLPCTWDSSCFST